MKKILVAEDEQNIREFVVINLERAGYHAFGGSQRRRSHGALRAGER